MNHKIDGYLILLILVLSLLACSPSIIPSDAGEQPGDPIIIASTNAFVDQFNIYHVVGLIVNTDEQAITSIELSIEIRDALGNSLFLDEDNHGVPYLTFSPHLITLGPDESSTFSFSYDTSAGVPSSYDVSLVGYQTGEVKRANLVVENARLINGVDGLYYLTGELVNQGSQWARIYALSGALADVNDTILSADWSVAYTTGLAPSGDDADRDRTPFIIQIPDPGADKGVMQWFTYWDADVIDAMVEYPITITITNSYLDSLGSMHVVGLLTNNAAESLRTSSVAGLYNEDNIVMNADWQFQPLLVESGGTIPYDFSSFDLIHYDTIQAERVERPTVQLDPWRTYPPSWEFIVLESADDQVRQDGATLHVTGNVVNTSEKNLRGATVIVAILDTRDTELVTKPILDAHSNLLATNYSIILPSGGVILPGEKIPYDVTIYLDPNADNTSYSFVTLVQGNINE